MNGCTILLSIPSFTNRSFAYFFGTVSVVVVSAAYGRACHCQSTQKDWNAYVRDVETLKTLCPTIFKVLGLIFLSWILVVA